MARTYTLNTIAAGSIAATGAALQTQLRDAIVANAAWTLVDEYDSTNASVHYTVFKCLASASGLTEDFFIMFYRTISSGSIGVAVGESYNSTTKVLVAGPDSSSPTSIAFDANGIPTLVPTLTCLTGTPSVVNGPNTLSISSAASLTLLTIVDVDHMIFNFNLNAVYMGAITSNMAADPKPVVFGILNATSSPGGAPGLGSLRFPPGATSPQPRNGVGIYGAMSNQAWIRASAASLSDIPDHCLGDKPPVWEIAVLHTVTTAAAVGTFRGRYKKVVAMSSSPAAAALGDYFPIDGTRWVVVGGGAGSTAILADSGVAV